MSTSKLFKRLLITGWLAIVVMILGPCITAQAQAASGDVPSGVAGHLVHSKTVNGHLRATGPASGVVKVYNAAKTQLIAEDSTDSYGNFRFKLPPGTYFVCAKIPGFGPYGRKVTVRPHGIQHIELDLPPH